MNKNIYTMRIVIVSLIAFLLGAVVGKFGNLLIISLAIGLVITSFFIYEGLSFDRMDKKEERIRRGSRCG